MNGRAVLIPLLLLLAGCVDESTEPDQGSVSDDAGLEGASDDGPSRPTRTGGDDDSSDGSSGDDTGGDDAGEGEGDGSTGSEGDGSDETDDSSQGQPQNTAQPGEEPSSTQDAEVEHDPYAWDCAKWDCPTIITWSCSPDPARDGDILSCVFETDANGFCLKLPYLQFRNPEGNTSGVPGFPQPSSRFNNTYTYFQIDFSMNGADPLFPTMYGEWDVNVFEARFRLPDAESDVNPDPCDGNPDEEDYEAPPFFRTPIVEDQYAFTVERIA